MTGNSLVFPANPAKQAVVLHDGHEASAPDFNARGLQQLTRHTAGTELAVVLAKIPHMLSDGWLKAIWAGVGAATNFASLTILTGKSEKLYTSG